jgi:hypothetical protein
MFERMTKNSLFSKKNRRILELLPIVLGFRDDLQGPRYCGTCLMDMYKNTVFTFYHRFRKLLPTFLEFWGNLEGP